MKAPKKITTMFLILPYWKQSAVIFTFSIAIWIVLAQQIVGDPVDRIYFLVPSIVSAIAVPLVLTLIFNNYIRNLMNAGKYADDYARKIDLLRGLIAQLRRPMPAKVHRMILASIADLPVKEEALIGELEAVTRNFEFFLPADDIMRAIDRLDLRRKLKQLEGGPEANVSEGATSAPTASR
jgi:hypothetical protein